LAQLLIDPANLGYIVSSKGSHALNGVNLRVRVITSLKTRCDIWMA